VGDGAKLYLLTDENESDKGYRLMTQAVALQVDDSVARELPASYLQEHWYAAYTCANHEKRIAKQLEERQVEHFLPLYRSVRWWSDRRMQIGLPLFPGYVFVRLALCDRLRVLQIPSIVRLVSFNGLPAALPDTEMEIMRSGLSQHLRAAPHPFLTVGRRMRITGGPFTGLEGIVLRRRNNFRVVLSLDLIQCSIAVDVDAAEVRPIARTGREAGATH
jgi:transcription termination/antitermination protein NusG